VALVLTRRVGESVQIGPDVRISVAGVKGNQVRLAIEAPAATRIMREELLERPAADQRPEAAP
jgi:carbon storage regulator